jgi:Protein of unknown function (DUF3253)
LDNPFATTTDLFESMHHSFDDPLSLRTRDCVIAMLAARGGRSICPSDAAMSLADELDFPWQDLMRLVRVVAANLADAGVIEVTQNGAPVNIQAARGPVRLRLKARDA